MIKGWKAVSGFVIYLTLSFVYLSRALRWELQSIGGQALMGQNGLAMIGT